MGSAFFIEGSTLPLTVLQLLQWGLKLVLLGAFIVSTNTGFAERVQSFAAFERFAALCAYLLIWLAAVLSVLAVAHLPSSIARLGWAVIIVITTFVSDVYHHVSGVLLSFDELQVLWAARSEADKMVVFYGPSALRPLVSALVGLAAISLAPPVPMRRARAVASASPLLPALLIGGVVYLKGGYGTEGLPNQYVAIALWALVLADSTTARLDAPRPEVQIPTDRPPATRHIALIVDESVRGDYLDLDGAEGTTPYLASIAGRVANYGVAASGNNCSNYSLALLRLGGRRTDVAKSVTSGPTIWQYARNAGFRTVYLDLQAREGRLQDFMTPAETSDIDEMIYPQKGSASQRDRLVAATLHEIFAREDSQFVLLVKHGAHFPYEQSYPESEAIFIPHMRRGEALGESRSRLLNSYRNALRWSVDGFFRDLLEGAELDDTVIIYTSDHGQNLMDQGLLTHCRAKNPSVYEGAVPLLVITDAEPLAAVFKAAARTNFDKASHFHIFPTLLHLLGYRSQEVATRYDETLLAPLTGERRFTSGSIFGRFGAEPTWNSLVGVESGALARP